MARAGGRVRERVWPGTGCGCGLCCGAEGEDERRECGRGLKLKYKGVRGF